MFKKNENIPASTGTSPSDAKTQRRQKRWLVLALGVIVLLFAAMIGVNAFKNYKMNQVLSHLPPPVNAVTVATLKPQDWQPTLSATGTVRANQGATLKVQASGVVESISVKAGQMVQKGQVLMTLDSHVEQANLQASEDQLPSLKNTYESYVQLYRTKSVSKQALDTAKANYLAKKAQIASLKAALSRRQIVAPFSGVAGIVKVNVGQFVNAGTDIVQLEDRSEMKVDFTIAQNDLTQLHNGETIVAQSDAYPNATFLGKITAIDPAVDQNSGLVSVQAVFTGDNAKDLLSGMFVRLVVNLPVKPQQVVVPQVAINFNMYGDYLYVVEPLSEKVRDEVLANPMFKYKKQIDRVFQVKQVPIFVQDRHTVNALLDGSGLKFGERFVVGGSQRLSKGALVIIEDKPLVGVTTPKAIGNL